MTEDPPAALASRLGYLLKHAQQDLMLAAAPAIARIGVDGRELAVLSVLGAGPPLSQQEAAGQLGIDRTTMVAILDALEDKGLVARQRSETDRRKNIVRLTTAGRRAFRDGCRVRSEVEHEYLAPLTEPQRRQFVEALQILVRARRGGPDQPEPAGQGTPDA